MVKAFTSFHRSIQGCTRSPRQFIAFQSSMKAWQQVKLRVYASHRHMNLLWDPKALVICVWSWLEDWPCCFHCVDDPEFGSFSAVDGLKILWKSNVPNLITCASSLHSSMPVLYPSYRYIHYIPVHKTDFIVKALVFGGHQSWMLQTIICQRLRFGRYPY